MPVMPETIGCPILRIESSAQGGSAGLTSIHLTNTRVGNFVNADGWYIFEAEFVVDSVMDEKESLFIIVSNMHNSSTYLMDNVYVLRSGTSTTCEENSATYVYEVEEWP